MSAHTYSVEKLVHYRCGRCNRWWSIGDGPTVGALRCPWCGHERVVSPLPPRDSGAGVSQRNEGGPEPDMNLRDYFAAKAMQGLLATPGGPMQAHMDNGDLTNCNAEEVSVYAYRIAAAMLAERGR